MAKCYLHLPGSNLYCGSSAARTREAAVILPCSILFTSKDVYQVDGQQQEHSFHDAFKSSLETLDVFFVCIEPLDLYLAPRCHSTARPWTRIGVHACGARHYLSCKAVLEV